jgi:hypothetical protein
MFKLYATIVTILNTQKKKGLQALLTNFTFISYVKDSVLIPGPHRALQDGDYLPETSGKIF